MKLKKVISMLLVSAMMIPNIVMARDKNTYADIPEKLYKLFLLESKPEDLEKEITRAEAVGYFLSFSGIEAGKDTGSYSFSDVDRKTQAAAHIEQAYMNGLVNGYEDNTFHPEENMTVAQAAVVFINILGYNRVANSNDYPYGIMQTANETGITKDMSVNPNENIKLGDFLKMMDNAKDTPPLELDISNLDKGSFVVDNDKSLLSEKHKIFYDKGIITANYLTSLTEETGYANSVVIGEELYELGERCTNESDLLGCIVEFYYYENKGDRVLLWAEPTSKNSILEIDSENIDDFSDGTYTYVKGRENGREYKASLDKYADVIYNGMVDLHPDESNGYIPEDGSVRLIDNDGDGKYEVVIIEEYTTIFAESVYTDSYTIVDKYTGGETVFEENGDLKIEFYKDGAKSGFSQISPNNVISYAKSRSTNSGSVMRVFISDKSIDGAVTYRREECGVWYVTIDGENYKLSSYARKNAGIEVRDSGTFYLDFKGNVVGLRAVASTGLQYGYLMKAYIDNEDTEKVVLKILTLSGKILFFDMAEKAKFNGETGVSNENIIELLKYGETGKKYDKPVGQPIKYASNTRGEVTKLITCITTPGGSTDVNKERIRPYHFYSWYSTYYPDTRSVGMSYGVKEDAVVFRIPDLNSQIAGLTTDADFSVEDINSYGHEWGFRFNAFDADDMNYCSLLLRVDELSSDTLDNPRDGYVMVENVSKIYDEETEEVIVRLETLANGAKQNLDVHKETVVINADSAADIKKGSIVQFYRLDNGKVGCMKVVMSPDSFTPADTYDGDRCRQNVYVRGQVIRKNSGALIISYEKNDDGTYKDWDDYTERSNKLWFVGMKTAPVYIYDKSTGNITITNNLSDVRDREHFGKKASLVMANMDYMSLKNLFVYNE